MIPWVREKFAERRAKWVASRNNKRSDKDTSHSTSEASCSSHPPPHFSGQSNSTQKHSKLKSNATSDEELKQKEKIRVRIVSPNGRVLAFFVDPVKRLIDLKQEILLELYEESGEFSFDVSEVWQFGEKYRLLKAESGGLEISENLTLEQLAVVDHDTFVLQKKRFYTQSMLVPKVMEPPTMSEIEQATRDVPFSRNRTNVMDINEIFQQSDLQFDVRKVIISLAQASACTIGAGPYAPKLISIMKQKVANKRNNQNDTLQCLCEMGFDKQRAKYALKLHNGIYSKTLEWLINHQTEEIPSDDDSMNRSMTCVANLTPDNSIVSNTEALLEIVRIYSHREIPPSKEIVGSLVEMGFEETDVLKALKKTCNNKAAACEYLCGNRSGSLIELRDGLAKDSPILQAILDLPKVQMSLSSPKVFLAFLAILENENTVRIYGGDNDTTTVITHILQKYHEEKHALGINQFYNPR